MTQLIQILENKISLLTLCVEFYSNENNYENKNSNPSLIENDKGFLARETLKKIQDLTKQNAELNDQFSLLTGNDVTPENILAKIKDLIENQK